MSKTKEYAKISINLNATGRLIVGGNVLAIPKTNQHDKIFKRENLEILLEGPNRTAHLIEGPINCLYDIIDKCYKARESQTSYQFQEANGTIIVFS